MEDFEGLTAATISDKKVGRFLQLFEVAKIVQKAQQKIAYDRLMANGKIPGAKLVKARSNRVWKDEAEAEALAKFKTLAMTKPELKSPAQIEALPGGDAFTTRYAFKPDKGFTVATDKDVRRTVDRDKSKLFSDVTKKAKKGA